MREFPEVFVIDSNPHYKKDSEAARDARIGWELCQEGRKLPKHFKAGMDRIGRYIGECVTQDNCHRMWSKWKIREDRAARDLSQLRYAALLGVTESAVSHWESGRKQPRLSIWFLITFSTDALKHAEKKARKQ